MVNVFANDDRSIDDNFQSLRQFFPGIFPTHILNQPPPGVYSNVVNEEVSVFSQDDPYKIPTILPIAH